MNHTKRATSSLFLWVGAARLLIMISKSLESNSRTIDDAEGDLTERCLDGIEKNVLNENLYSAYVK